MSDDHVNKTVATYNAIANHYAVQMDAYTPVNDRELFLSYLHPHSRVLDVGCAAGRDSMFFTKHGHMTTGIDLSEKLLAIARKKAPALTFLHDDIRKKMFADESFDAVWACAVLLHLTRKEIPTVLKIFYAMLVIDGLCIFALRKAKGERRVRNIIRSSSRHFTYFMPDELKNCYGCRVY